jgi:photosystem II stability/assembly factor-like uncharacterized protein
MKKLYFVLIITFSTLNIFGQWQQSIAFEESISNFESIEFTSSGKGMITGYTQIPSPILDGYVLRSLDYGATWDTSLVYPLSIIKDISILNDSTAFAIGSYNSTNTVVAKTTDFGNTWDTTLFNISTYIMSTIDFPSDSIGYIGCIKGLYKTVNAGDTWLLIDTVTNFQYKNLTFINDTIGYYGAYLKTIDGGYTWFQFMPFSCAGCYASYPSDSMCYIALWDYDSMYTYKSIDAGVTWEIVSAKYSDCFIKTLFFINDTIGYCGGFWNSQKTIDGGLTWINQSPVSDWICDIFFTSVDTGYIISSVGECWRTFNGGETFIKNNITPDENILKIYPNPTTGKIRVQAEDIESIEVFDITGKHLTGFENLSGLKELDLSSQPKGIYIIKVRTSKGVAVEKIVLE